MKRTRIVLLFATFCFFSAGTLIAQSHQSYLLMSDGSVRVNGVLAPLTMVVLPGDVVETDKGATGKISAPGISMLVGQNSRVSAVGDQLVVNSGSAVVSTTTNRVTAEGSQYSITTAGTGAAKYQVAVTGSALSVVSDAGQLKITGPTGNATKLVAGEKAILSTGSPSISLATATLVTGNAPTFQKLSGTFVSPPCRNNRQCP